MNDQEIFYTIALTRMMGFNAQTALHLYREMGSATAIYEHHADIKDCLPDCTDRLAGSLRDWDAAQQRAAQEMAFIQKHHIKALCLNDEAYPLRLKECPDAPVILYYMGTADLNQTHIINIVGTRRCTSYGQDLVRHFMADLRRQCPNILIVSGLAYGIDICAHRQALQNGFETVAVLAHGLDEIYPTQHRETAKAMLSQGGLLTEYMTETRSDKMNFVRRNRIVAGMCDATVLVESAAKGGGLITARIAQDYDRSVFAFPGAVGAAYSEGCNHLIRDNVASLITSADDFVAAMGWQSEMQLQQAKQEGIERSIFPDLTPEEQAVVRILDEMGDFQLNQLSVRSNIPIGQLTAILFSLEMKGVVRPMAGGNYHLLK